MFCPWSRPWELKMDSVQVSLLVLGLVLVLSVQTGYANIMCYECNSAPEYDGDECGDPFVKNPDFLKNCSGEYQYCRKIAQMVEEDYRIVRQCATDGRVNECVDRTGTKAVKVTYCACDGDNCNAANPMYTTSLFLLTVSSALLALICHS